MRGFAAALLWGTIAAAQPTAFDVASVRRAPDNDRSGYRVQLTRTGLTMKHVSLGFAIRFAYRLSNQFDLAGPEWLDPPTLDTYDIDGRVAEPVSEDVVRACLRALLADRFGLRAHRETRLLPVFVLTAGRDAPRLQPSTATKAKVRSGNTPYRQIFEHVTMAQLALQLGPPTCSRPVLDRTAINGYFDFTLDLSPYVLDAETGKPILDWRGAIDTERATIRAVRDQLRLNIVEDRAPYEVLVVDSARPTPSIN